MPKGADFALLPGILVGRIPMLLKVIESTLLSHGTIVLEIRVSVLYSLEYIVSERTH